jgi:oligopeptide/dipeptide ABC transporter ATP-binding protein
MTQPALPLLAVTGLRKYFPLRNAFHWRTGSLRAVDDVSFAVWPGEILGLVGESGCGKSTLGKTLIGIHRPNTGSIRFDGEEIARLPLRRLRQIRGRLQYSYQDPGAALDPQWKIRRALHEPLRIHGTLDREARASRIREILAAVNLPESLLDRFPHELSGGQLRRVGLARILTLKPRLVILDEPTSGLDVSVQASVLALFQELRRAFDLTYIFISHDLSVVRLICDRVAVMYLGRIVETGATQSVFANPRHPYTRSLLAAVPRIGGSRITDHFWLEGEPPDPHHLPSGCRFRTRCPQAEPRCAEHDPPLRENPPGHAAACLLDAADGAPAPAP